MTQNNWEQTANPLSGAAQVAFDNLARKALLTSYKGSTAPAYLQHEGAVWCDDSADPVWVFKVWDGSQWRSLYSINSSTGATEYLNLATASTNSSAVNKAQLDSAIFYKKQYNSTIAPDAYFAIANASAFANTIFYATCWSGGSSANDGFGSFSAGYNGVPNLIAQTGIASVSSAHNWASPPDNKLVIGKEGTSNEFRFLNTTSLTLNLTVYRTS